MPATFFVTGTDTDVGKTFIATALLEAAKQQGLSTAAIKPVAAGCEKTSEGLRNQDALQLQQAMTIDLAYPQVNPVSLSAAIAPHIAAQQENKSLSVSRLAGFCRGVMMQSCDLLLIEGAGGWRVPLNKRETLADLAKTLSVDIVLVVGMRLGCINHALLSAEAIMRDGLTIRGWVANQLDRDMPVYRENVDTLKALLPAPCIGEIPYSPGRAPAEVAGQLDIQLLLKNT